MAAINFDFIRQKELSQTKHRPENVGAVITLVLFYKNLHDHYGFGRTRFLYRSRPHDAKQLFQTMIAIQ